MSLLPQSITLVDAHLDAFARLRTSDPTGLFNNQNEYDTSPLFWEDQVAGTGAITHLPNESSVQLSTGGTASGALAARQTRQHIRYQPGKSQLVLLTFLLGAGVANVRRRVGYFDASNGIFLEQDGTNGLYFVRRTSVTGSPVDNRVARADWRLDSIVGTGFYPTDVDEAATQILFMDLEWLGVGRVRCGFVVNGCLHYAHTFRNTNDLTEVYMTTANLPLRYEVENTGTAAAPNTLKQICGAVSSEGGFESDRALIFSADNGVTARNITTTPLPLLAIRPKTTFGKTNRGSVLPLGMDMVAQGTNIFVLWQLVYNPAVTGGAWASVNASSITEQNTTATSITGGLVLASGYITSTSQSRASLQERFSTRLTLTNNIAGNATTPLVLMLTTTSGSGTALASLRWAEFY